jgi:hypothetical protein
MLVKQVMSRIQFNNQINDTIQRFQKKIPIEFTRTLDLIRIAIQGNALVAVFSLNWRFIVPEKSKEKNASFRMESISYINIKHNTSCSCITSHTCTMPAQLLPSNVTPSVLEGLVMGCNQLETVLLSSLFCFYSLTCINDIRLTLELDPFDPKDFTDIVYPFQLNPSLTRFNVNATIETLASEMFIESWTSNVSYERFFNSCAPSSCTYKYYYRFDALGLLTTFLTVYGGLSLGIRFIVPYLVQMIKRIRNRIRITPL